MSSKNEINNPKKNSINSFSKDLRIAAFAPFIKRNSLLNKHLNLFKNYTNFFAANINTNYEKQIYFYTIGIIQFKSCLYNEAITSFSEAIYERPEYASALIMRALCYLKTKKLDSAYDDAALAALYEPKLPLASYIHAYISYKRKDNDIALESIEKAIKLKNNDAYYYLLKGKILNKLNKPEKAEEALKTSMTLDYSQYFLFEYGKHLINQNQIQNGIKILSKIKDYPHAGFIIAKTLFPIDKHEAKKYFQRLLTSSIYREISLLYLSRIFVSMRNFEIAEKTLSKIILKYGKNYKLLTLFAKLLYLNKKYILAEKIIKIAEKLFLLSKKEPEYSLNLLTTRIKILLKTKNIDRETILVPLLRFEKLVKNDPSKNILLERFYSKLFDKFQLKRDYKKLKELKLIKGKDINSSFYLDKTGKLKKRTVITAAIIFIIIIIFFIINTFSN